MKLIDTHIHLDFAQFDADRLALLNQADTAGIKGFVIPATTRQSWPKITQLCEASNQFAAYGMHPYFIDQHQQTDLIQLERWIAKHQTLAIGEIGLDYFLPQLDKTRQQYFFDAQLAIAAKNNLGVILHVRKAVQDIIQALKQYQNKGLNGGIAHSYNGSLQQAHQLIDFGIKLGFGGAITYPRATRLHALIRALPLSSIVLETDAPDQPPLSLNQQRNKPIALLEVFEALCALRNESKETILAQINRNIIAVFPDLKSCF